MDIKLNSIEGKFKFRVCGILEHNGKYLIVKINHNKFYCLPGGHIELGEDTETAVKREMKEELGYEVEVKKLISINQNFFYENGIPFHELGFYYLVVAKNPLDIITNDYSREELDKGKIQHLEFKWATIEELKSLDFKPEFIIDAINSKKVVINVTKDKNPNSTHRRE